MFECGCGVDTAGSDGAAAASIELKLVVFKPESNRGHLLVTGRIGDLGDDFDVAGIEDLSGGLRDLFGAGEFESGGEDGIRKRRFPVA